MLLCEREKEKKEIVRREIEERWNMAKFPME